MPTLPARLIELVENDATGANRSIVIAAAELFAEQGIANVSLRAVAERAGVNYNYIYRHFSTKESLLVELVHYWTRYGATFVDASPTAEAAVRAIFQADAGRFAEILAWVAIEGTDAATVFDDTSTVDRLRGLLEQSWSSPSQGGAESQRPFDPRVVVAVLTLLILTWDFYAPYMHALCALDDRGRTDVREEVVEVMMRLIDATRLAR